MSSTSCFCSPRKTPLPSFFRLVFDFLQLYIVGFFVLIHQYIFARRPIASVQSLHFSSSSPIILLTGATSGIGQALLHRLDSEGVQVVALVHQTSSDIPSHITQIPLDLSSAHSVREVASRLATFLLDFPNRRVVLFHCAGVYFPLHEDPVLNTLHVNLLSPTLLLHLLSPHLSGIVWLGSASHFASPDIRSSSCVLHAAVTPYNAYPLSKMLPIAVVEHWAKETGAVGVVIHPGVVATGLYRRERGWIGELLRVIIARAGWSKEISAERVLQTLTAAKFWKRCDLVQGSGRTSNEKIYFDAVTFQMGRVPTQMRAFEDRSRAAQQIFDYILGNRKRVS